MDTTQNLDGNAEIKRVHQLLAKSMEDFKYLALCNMRLEENMKVAQAEKHLEQNNDSVKDVLRLDLNRISNFEEKTTAHEESKESLEDWVNREFAAKSKAGAAKKDRAPFAYIDNAQNIEEWVASSQKVKSKNNKPKTIIDIAEQWLINEAKKDLFAEIDAINGGPENLSSEHVRDLGMTLIALADKLDKIKSNKAVASEVQMSYAGR